MVDYDRAKQIFTEAVELAREDRGAYLDEHCAGDADLRAQVEELLLNHQSTLKDPTSDAIEGDYQRGDTIAHFTIRDRLGSGGMGAVYLAEQSVPVKRRVALKVIKPGFDTRSTLARFQAERQALARMDHPNIAKVLEAGATEAGRPWFAMEYIKGEDLLAYCDDNKLDTRQRLELFIKICSAIQHAHQRGIMHRDLKPGNIMITRDEDDTPQPKVIDFGIAKAISSDLTDMTLHTVIGQMVGTLSYMSPEQVRGSEDIDTRTDVYSLGVILYELVSGQVPFSGKTVGEAGLEAMKKSIREMDPPKPSTQLSSIDVEKASAIAQSRRTDTGSLQSTLRRELEWIPLKALRKDRGERYASPDDLGRDVQRYLDGEALEAGPVTRRYRVKKFVKRNKGPVITAASFILVLIAATVVSLSLLAEAERQRTLADEAMDISFVSHMDSQIRSGVIEEIRVMLYGIAEIIDSDEQKVKVIEILEDMHSSLDGIRADGSFLLPEASVQLRTMMAQVYQAISEFNAAAEQLQLGLDLIDLYTQQVDSESSDLADDALVNGILRSERPFILLLMGYVHRDNGSPEDARKYFQESIDEYQIQHGDQGEGTIRASTAMADLLYYQGYTLSQAGKSDEATPYLIEALEIRRRMLGDEDPDTIMSIGFMGEHLMFNKKFEEAMPYYVEALEAQRRVLGDEHPSTLNSIYAMGYMLSEQGKYDEAMLYCTELLAIQRRVLGDEHPSTLDSMSNMRLLLYQQGKYDEAAKYHQMINDIQANMNATTAEPVTP